MADDTQQRFQTVLESFTTGMLVTHDEAIGLRGRPMRVAKVEDAGNLWFPLDEQSATAAEAQRSTKAGVAVVFQDGGRYLSLTGTPSLVQDREMVDELWTESWRVWFPGGKEDDRLCLLRIDAEKGEYWDNGGARGFELAIRAGAAYWLGRTPEINEGINAKVDLS